MTVETLTNTVTYTSNGLVVPYPFNFYVILAQHLQVEVEDAATGVSTVLSPSLYSISGLGNEEGGSVTPTPAIPNLDKITITRIVPYTQPLDILNQGGFYPATLEEQLDLTVMQIQQLAELTGRALLFPRPELGQTLPPIVAGSYFAVDADGRVVYASGTGADGALRVDLAAPGGAGLIGVSAGGSLQAFLDAIVTGDELASVTALLGPRTAPHANFAWLGNLGWSITGCRGVGQASMNMDIRDVFEANYGAFIGASIAWVAPDGNDTTGIGSFSAPYLTIGKAVTTSAYTILIKPGVYPLADSRYTYTLGTAPKRFIAPQGGVTMRVVGPDLSAQTWTANGTFPNVWECTLPGTEVPLRILLNGSNDGYGELVELAMGALETEVAATATSMVNASNYAWWFNTATRLLQIRYGVTNVETTLKNQIRAVYGNSGRDNRILLYATNSYWENITVEGYMQLLEQTGQATPQVWLKNMTFRYGRTDCLLNGGGYYHAQNCYMHSGTADGFKINNGIVRAHGIEIDCVASSMGAPFTFDRNQTQVGYIADSDMQIYNPIAISALNKNASSNHTGDVIRVNARYGRCAGPTVADTAGSYSWNVGCNFDRPTLRSTSLLSFGLIAQGAGQKTWNDSCVGVGANAGFTADSGAAMLNFGSSGTTIITGGTIGTYVPA